MWKNVLSLKVENKGLVYKIRATRLCIYREVKMGDRNSAKENVRLVDDNNVKLSWTYYECQHINEGYESVHSIFNLSMLDNSSQQNMKK